MLSSNRIHGPIHFRKALNLIFPKLSSQNMHGFDHATILSTSFHGLRKECLAQWLAFSVLKMTKNSRGGTSRKIKWKIVRGCAERLLKPLPYFRPKSVIFPFFKPDQKFDTEFQTWSPGARHMTGVRDKLFQHVHGSWRKHQKGNGVYNRQWRSS